MKYVINTLKMLDVHNSTDFVKFAFTKPHKNL